MTKVFVSWSQELSRQVALALRDELPSALQGVEVWMSTNIKAGTLWSDAILKELSESQLGILCLTKDNLTAPWLLFEAGFLARQFSPEISRAKTTVRAMGTTARARRGEREIAQVIPYCFHLTPKDVAQHSPPLSLFQIVSTDKAGTLHLFQKINDVSKSLSDPADLTKAFKRFWRDFASRLSKIVKDDTKCDRELCIFPCGPSIKTAFIPDRFIGRVANKFDERASYLDLVRKANALRETASDTPTNGINESTLKFIEPGLLVTNATAYAAWCSIFEEAGLMGPRMLAAVLMVLRSSADSFGQERMEFLKKIEALLHKLKSLSLGTNGEHIGA